MKDTMTTTVTKERPVLFSGPMVRAVLDGRKTQTRRVVMSGARNLQESGQVCVKRNPDNDPWYKEHVWSVRGRGGIWNDYTHEQMLARCPYGVVGDRLWVREAFWSKHDTDFGDYGVCTANMDILDLGREFHPGWDYVATPECQDPPKGQRTGEFVAHEKIEPGDWWFGPPDDWDGSKAAHDKRGRWLFLPWEEGYYTKHPSIHMPRWMSRISLEVVGVRVEQVKDISHEDAVAEGCYRIEPCEAYPNGNAWGRAGFSALWDSINKDRGYVWEANPVVWVVEFRRMNTESDKS